MQPYFVTDCHLYVDTILIVETRNARRILEWNLLKSLQLEDRERGGRLT